MRILSFLDKENAVADSSYNRWLAPPVALAMHLSIGQIYAYSIFNKPLSQLLGITESVPGDWNLTALGWIFSLAVFISGTVAAVCGKWLDRIGPKKAMFYSAITFSGGFFVATLGVHFHLLWLVFLGHGLLGGIGIGLGYVAPVSVLIKWFPDRPGMATGLAIMGFGGGAMFASPISVMMMDWFRTSTSNGVEVTFMLLGAMYFVLMIFATLTVKTPPRNYKPRNWTPPKKQKISASHFVDADTALKTPQFYLMFLVFMLNITAGIGVLGQASLMIQEMFSVESVGEKVAVGVAAAAGFVGLLSIFNMLGRFFWSSLSDKIGRKTTYTIFFLVGSILYFLIPTIGNSGNIVLFILTFGIIITMFGGGFATIPTYIKDIFGAYRVAPIHGRLLFAWALAAVLGPVLINYIREYQIYTLNMPAADAYSVTMYIMAGLLVVGLIANLFIRPVNKKHFKDIPVENNDDNTNPIQPTDNLPVRTEPIKLILIWSVVTIPLLWGLYQVVLKSIPLFVR